MKFARSAMKLLVFAHIPPPHHGQSYMVKLMLDGFGGDVRLRSAPTAPDSANGIDCFHVDARLSETLEDIGSFRFGKLLLLLRYCFEAIWCRIRHGVRAFYYVPAPGKRAALYRDWFVMLLCRPFFSDFVHHWHAFGLGDWLKHHGSWLERRITHWLLGKPSLGLSLAIPSMRDALWFRSNRVELVPNGIPDPCPDFESTVLARRKARVAARRALLLNEDTLDGEVPADVRNEDVRTYRVLFLANLLRDKGTFDVLDAVAIANAKLRETNSPMRIHLTTAGALPVGADESEFHSRIARADIAGTVEWAGFVIGEKKSALLRECDCLCFPSFYHAESFGLVVVEAMAAGMAVVTTRWRALPDLLPSGYPGIVPIRRPDLVADAMIASMTEDATGLRARFINHFTEAAHIGVLRDALLQLDHPS